MKKRAQGSAAASLIGIITLLLIFYILFLPPAEREALLADEITADMPGGVPGLGDLLYSGAPGRLTYLPQTEFDHIIPNIVLTEERQAKILAEANPFIIKKGWFRKQFKNISFVIAEPETVDNVLLSFQAPLNRGRLKIFFNGVPVFEGDVKVANPQPIRLPAKLVQVTNNVEFQVWGFGLIFSRRYDIEDVKIIGEILDIRKQEAANSFSIPAIEFENIESGYLGIYPICDQETVGLLDITLNGRTIHSSVPVCDGPTRQDLFQEDFKEGKNTLGFKLRSGLARLEQIRIKTYVKPTKGFSDFFFVEPDVFNAIITGQANAVLYIEFVDDGRLKEAETNINGRLDVLTQREPLFIRDISAVIKDGNNFIGIQPLSDLNIINLEVRVE